MNITPVKTYNPSFQAHKYQVYPKLPMIEIQTDNIPNLGNDPYLFTTAFKPHNSEKMAKEGRNFFSDIFSFAPKEKYHIEYRDTGRKDTKNGSDYEIDCQKMVDEANIFLNKLHKRPLFHTIKAGKTVGKLKLCDFDNENDLQKAFNNIKEPSVIMTKSLHGRIPDNPNITGIIFIGSDFAAFSHYATQLRNNFNVCASIFDNDLLAKLEKLNGRNIELNADESSVTFQSTNKPARRKEFPQIVIPKLKYTDKILTSNEYTPDKIGAKAVNLRRLEKMAEQGKIDAVIPKSIALPFGYIEKFLSGNPNRSYNDAFCRNKTEALKREIEKHGINSPEIMVRSSFNGEDLSDFSAAGIYDTVPVSGRNSNFFNYSLYGAVKKVAESKNSGIAQQVFKNHRINSNDIKPGIIIQNGITPDYKFTLYSDDNKGNVRIDLISGGSKNFAENKVLPHMFTYNKHTGKMSYDSIQLGDSSVTFNEDMKIIGHSPIENDLSGKKDLFEKLKKLAKTAMAIERESGAPQDIEGGIKDGKIYLWQSRNIVNY